MDRDFAGMEKYVHENGKRESKRRRREFVTFWYHYCM